MEGSFHLLVRRGETHAVRTSISERKARGNPRELKELVGARDPFGNTPLHYAAEGHPEIVELLLACGSPIIVIDARNNEGSTPLHQAAFGNFYQCVQLLLSNGAFVNVTDYDGSTPLHHGAANNAFESVTLLIAHGASKETKDSDGYTALHHAAFNNSAEVLQLLLKSGADMEARDSSEGTTALHLASFGGYYTALQMLVTAGADIHAIDNDGATPLHKAAFQGFTDCLDYLISRGADVNRKDNTLSTPLHLAAYQGQLACMERLVKSGAKLNETNKHGRTPLQLATAKGHHQCIEFLKNAHEVPVPPPTSPKSESPSSLNNTKAIPLEEDQLVLIDKLIERETKAEKPVQELTEIELPKEKPIDELQSREDGETAADPSEHKEKSSSGPAVADALPVEEATKKSSSRKDPLTLPQKQSTKSKSADSASSNRSWRYSDEEESEEKGWIFEEKPHQSETKQDLSIKTDGQTNSPAASKGDDDPKKKKKKKKKKLPERQPKDRDSPRERESSKDDKRVLHGLSKMIKTASFQISPRRRKDTDDILERFAVLTAAEKEPKSNGSSEAIDSSKESEAYTAAKDPSDSDITENDGDATLTSYLSDSDDSDDEFGDKEINYSKLDKYGFLKDETESSDISTSKRRNLEAARALKWSKIIQHWGSYKRKKKLPKLQGRVAKGIPDCVRGTVWKLVVDASAVQRELAFSYTELHNKAHNTKDARQIDLDIKRTYRNHFMFREKKGIGQKALSNILKAYSIYNTEIGYCQGMADIAALLVMYMEEEEAWWTLVALIKRYAMQGLFSPGFPRLFQCFSVHEQLLQRHLPALQSHFTKCGIETAMYATKWYMDIFLGALPFPVTLRVWDLYMWGGPDVVYRFSLAVLKYFESDLLTLNFEDALSFINELPKRRIDPFELIKVYKKMQTVIKTSRIVKLEDEYASSHAGKTYLVYRRDHLIAADSTEGQQSRSNRGGTVIVGKTKSDQEPTPPPVPIPQSASFNPDPQKSSLHELLKSM